jgi:hypothetical protein
MRFSRCFPACGSFGSLLLLAIPSVFSAPPEALKTPPRDWKSTEVLRLSVEKWPAAIKGGRETRPAAYTVDVSLLDIPTGTDLYWILRFDTSASAPKDLRGSRTAWVVKDGGWIAKIGSDSTREAERRVLSINGASALVQPMDGVPVELLLPTLSKKKYVTEEATLEVLREEDGDGVIMVAIINIRGQDKVQITQTWKKGERWWREYTREINGRKDLHAKFHSVLTTTQVWQEKALRENPNAFLTWDKRLAVQVTLVKDNPKLSDLVDLIQKAAGVTLVVDDSLRGYEPQFGSCQLRDCPAWVVVNMISEYGYHKARWHDHNKGYRLKPATTMTDAGLKKLAGDAGLKKLIGVKDLTTLNLFNTQVTNAGMKELAHLKDLTSLDLSNTRVTDAGVKELAGLKNLTSLDLDSTQVTDAVLNDLVGLTKLRNLNLSRTQVTSAGLGRLRKELPGCHIVR